MKVLVNGESIVVAAGDNLMTALLRNNGGMTNICNGKGTCGKCKVRIVSAIPEATEVEYQKLSERELADGVRLACQVTPGDGMKVVLDLGGSIERKEELLGGTEGISDFDAGLRRVFVCVPQPSLQDERADWDRLRQELQRKCLHNQITIGLPELKTLTDVIRAADFKVTAVLWGQQVLAIRPGEWQDPLYGIAIDIGTTNVAGALYDLETGRLVRVIAAENGQTKFGADVVSRIEFANSGQEKQELLKQAVTTTINGIVAKLCAVAEIDSNDIFKVVIVGNTTMHHLFLGLDVSKLALSPFVSACNLSLELTAKEVGLAINPQSRIIMFPNIGGFVGGDTLGAVLGGAELLQNGIHLLVDIGTNCELYLQAGNRMWACSTAAGPAFEGAGITYGMRAQPGAIERVTMDGQGVEIKVIGNDKAIGICGSGLMDAVSQMRQSGVITGQGKIVDPFDSKVALKLAPALKSRIRNGKQGREFVLAYNSGSEDIALTQQDISQLQLAKGAICAGIRTMLDIAEVTVENLESVILAGTFAAHLNLASILAIGMIPNMSVDKLKIAGNAAHTGAVKALLNQQVFEGLQNRANNICHVELGGSSIFSQYFMESMYIEPCELVGNI
jgi:uncharacterized 2Fe-2S/4Fe-4S cluster protein (DUF4445 family)